MAITKLPIDYTDSVTEKYKYKLSDADNGDTLIEDTSDYSVVGSYFGAREIKLTRGKVNEVIEALNNSEENINYLFNGNFFVSNVEETINAKKSNTTDFAQSVSTCTNAINVNTAKTVEESTYSETTKKLLGCNVNGVFVDGTQNVTLADNTKVSLDDSFILQSKARLTFSNKVCEINDSRIKADSLAEVVFTKDCLQGAMKSVIDVFTYDGYLEIVAGRTPKETLYATIYVRAI